MAAAAGGGLLLMRLRVPGGMLVGAILGAVLVNLTTGQAYIWPQTRVVAQVLTGAYIGCLVTTEDLRRLPRVIRPYLAVMSLAKLMNTCLLYTSQPDEQGVGHPHHGGKDAPPVFGQAQQGGQPHAQQDGDDHSNDGGYQHQPRLGQHLSLIHIS